MRPNQEDWPPFCSDSLDALGAMRELQGTLSLKKNNPRREDAKNSPLRWQLKYLKSE